MENQQDETKMIIFSRFSSELLFTFGDGKRREEPGWIFTNNDAVSVARPMSPWRLQQ